MSSAPLSGILACGSYVLSLRGNVEPSATILIRQFQTDPASPQNGQWLLDGSRLQGTDHSKLKFCLHRLGVLPLRFNAGFVTALKCDRPMCIVADTNALYHGSLLQSLTIRGARATHVVVPDQVFMELQRQRETQWKKSILAERELERVKRMGRHVVHYSRPPDALVRYFGSQVGGSTGDGSDDDDVSYGPSHVRDRLVLEVARQQRALLGNVPVWVLSSDLAAANQAWIEDFDCGFCEPSTDQRIFASSPFVEPHSLAWQHVPLHELIDEIAVVFGTIHIQRFGDPTGYVVATLPEGERASQLRAKLDGQPFSAVSLSESSRGRTPWPVARVLSPSVVVNVPIKAPSAKTLLEQLLVLTRDRTVKAPNYLSALVPPYLEGLGLAVVTKDEIAITPLGDSVAKGWDRAASRIDDIETWRQWVADVGAAAAKLEPVAMFLSNIEQTGSSTERMQARLSWAQKTVEAVARFVSSWGLATRYEGIVFPVRAGITSEQAREAVQLALSELGRNKPAVPVVELFRRVAREGFGILDFRAALNYLREQGAVTVGGSAPETGIGMRGIVTIVHPTLKGDVGADVDLGKGDWLVPSQSSQVARLKE